MNDADAWRLSEELHKRGYQRVRRPEEADLVVLITCVVRQSAEDRAIGFLSSLKPLKKHRPQARLVVMGCLVGDVPALQRRFPYVDLFVPPSDVSAVLAFVDQTDQVANQQIGKEALEGRVAAPVSAYVPVIHGCDHHCTYCIVRLRRGPERSRPIPEVVAEVEELVTLGAREVTLLGQNVDSYGHDLPGHPDLADLLRAVHEVEGLYRIRFLTSHPAHMSERIINAVAELPKVCEHIELPVQAGDDQVLRRMGRGYTAAEFRDLVHRIRQTIPGVSIATDVIVGFPGESEAQFQHTLDLLEELRFDVVHVAAYSPRPGTPAARLPDDVPPEEKERRRRAVEKLQERIAGEINARLLGQTVEVLVEGRRKGRWKGRTRTNKLVFFEGCRRDDYMGKLVQVHITWTGPWSLIGEVVDHNDRE